MRCVVPHRPVEATEAFRREELDALESNLQHADILEGPERVVKGRPVVHN